MNQKGSAIPDIPEFNFERFNRARTKGARGLAKITTTFANGKPKIGLNRAALDLLGDPVSVILGYDREQGVVGLRVAQGERYAYKVARLRGSGGYVNVIAFVKHYGIEMRSQLFRPEMQGEWLCFRLADGHPLSPRVSSRKRRDGDG